MKRVLSLLLLLLILAGLCACGGNVKDVRIDAVPSELYSEKDIQSAIHTIVREFDRKWSGCTLTYIAYAGDERTAADSEYYADLYGTDQLIVLTSSFEVDSSGGDGSLNPNSTYDGWSWTLIRNSGGRWEHVDHGYG